jgi:hypothetical protein
MNNSVFEELQMNIRHEISAMHIKELQSVSKNIFSPCEVGIEAKGSHFETLL